MPNLKVLGHSGAAFAGIERIEAPAGVQIVTYTTDEVTALCPVTEQPDWYTVAIEIMPADALPESKSLKLYLQSFRDQGIFCEAFAARIASDVQAALAAALVTVTVTQRPRGGISITAQASVTREGARPYA